MSLLPNSRFPAGDPERYLRQIDPKRGWLDGVAIIAADRYTRWQNLRILIGYPILALALAYAAGFVLERMWHPLYYLPWITLYPLLRRIAFDPLGIAARHEAEVVKEAVRSVDLAVNYHERGKRFLSDDDALTSLCMLLANGGAQARECVLRLAALRTRSSEIEPQEMRDIATAIVRRHALNFDQDAIGRRKRSRRGEISRIAGVDVDTLSSRMVFDQTGSRLREIAETALSHDPTLADAGGAPLAPLVRKHLPDLLEAHAHTMRLADTEGAKVAERQLAEGLERIRMSVEEALDASRAEAMSRLSTQVHFLRMRRGDSQ